MVLRQVTPEQFSLLMARGEAVYELSHLRQAMRGEIEVHALDVAEADEPLAVQERATILTTMLEEKIGAIESALQGNSRRAFR